MSAPSPPAVRPNPSAGRPARTLRAWDRVSGASAARTMIAGTLLLAALATGSLLLAVLSTVTLLLPRPAGEDRDEVLLPVGSPWDDALTVDGHRLAVVGADAGEGAELGGTTLTVDQQHDLELFRAQLRDLPELDPRA